MSTNHFIEQLQVITVMRLPSLVVFHASSVSAEAISAAIRAHIGKQTTVVRLRSDSISEDEGNFIRDVLLQGQVLVLIGGEHDELPGQLLKAWERFRESPRHSHTGAGRFIRFEASGDSEGRENTSGILVLVLPTGYKLALDGELRAWISSPEELGPPAPPLNAIRDLSRPPVAGGLSMKTLYFLHHRDSLGVEHHDSVEQIMKGDQRLTWGDLRRLLQQQPDQHMLDILDGFAGRGRISVEQLDLAAAAVLFIHGEKRKDERIGWKSLAPTIYHALWSYGRVLQGSEYVFRGQRDSRWRQDTMLFRSDRDTDGAPPTLDTIVRRLQRTQAFLDALAGCERELVGRDLDDDERLAIAQHYGMPTPLLDYTRSLEIAAFFATGSGDASVLKEGDVGVIYYVSLTDAVTAEGNSTSNSFEFAAAAGIRIGQFRVIEPHLPDAEDRIARQKGLFIDGFDSRDLQRMSTGVLYFRQQPGEAFQDPRLGITRDSLLSPNAKLQRLASVIAVDSPRFSNRLTAARIPGDDLFGALGLSLRHNLGIAQEFLNDVAKAAERVSPGLWSSISAILTRHLNEARIKARTADISATGPLGTAAGSGGIDYVLDEVDQALVELATVGDLPPDALRKRLSRHRPFLGPDSEPINAPSPTPKATVVTAVGTFIVGLEYLRTVRGKMASRYIQEATSALYPFIKVEGKWEQ
jgi:hypothetical protein